MRMWDGPSRMRDLHESITYHTHQSHQIHLYSLGYHHKADCGEGIVRYHRQIDQAHRLNIKQ